MTRSFNLWKNNILRHFLNFRKKQQEVFGLRNIAFRVY